MLVDLLHVLEVVLLLQLPHQHRLLVGVVGVLLLGVRPELRERLRVQRVLLCGVGQSIEFPATLEDFEINPSKIRLI